jgi:membrane protein implicated in regulation of membrane protease activity
MLLDLLIGLVLFVVVLCLAMALLCAYLSLPLADRLNEFFRRVGLAGPSPGSRAAGVAAVGVVASRFDLRAGEGRGKVFAGGELWSATCPARLAPQLEEGDRVDVVYGDDLTVRVLGRAGGGPASAGGGAGETGGQDG